MSRHDFEHTDPETGATYEIAVGWDRPLQTFFAQVFIFPIGVSTADEPILFSGCDIGEHDAPESVLALLRDYFPIPDDLGAKLEADRDATRNQKDGPSQIFFKDIIRRTS